MLAIIPMNIACAIILLVVYVLGEIVMHFIRK